MSASLRRRLPLIWRSRGWQARALLPLAWLYAWLLGARTLIYRVGLRRVERLPVPVLVVGNVVAGGSGKTPAVIAIVEHLRARGWTPGVIARGYGRQRHEARRVDGTASADDVGDEPQMVWRRTGVPTAVGAQRVQAARLLLRQAPQVDILVSDDGLQHLALGRQVEIVVSGSEGMGNGWLLPAGPLREPWPRRFDLLLDAGAVAGTPRFGLRRRLDACALGRDGRRTALADLVRADAPPVWALAAIAHPERFFDMLRQHGLVLAGTLALADHAPIRREDLAACGDGLLLCTEKDADKVWRLRPDALAVPLALDIDPEFWPALERLLPAPRKRPL